MSTSDPPAVSKNLDLNLASHAASAKAQIVDKDQRLSAVFGIAKILATEHDLETMLPRFLSCLIETLEAVEAGILLLHDPSDGQLTVRAAQGYELTALEQIRLAPGESLCGKVFQTGRAELYSTPEAVAAAMANMTPANREVFRAAATGLGQPQSVVCMPLITDRAKVGVLVLENLGQPGSFAHADLPFLQEVTDLIALWPLKMPV